MKAYLQNSFEILFICAILVIAMIFPSLVSAGFAVLTHLLLIPSYFDPQKRIKWGLIIQSINLVVLIVLIFYKA